MRLNWGSYIVMAIIGFIGFILFFVVQMLSSEHSQDLVREAYYHDELMFQQEIDKHKRTQKLEDKFQVISTSEGLKVIFPEDVKASEIVGSIQLYRPSNKALDTKLDIQLSENQQLIGKDYLLKGRWDVLINFSFQDEEYSYKKEIVW